VQDEKILSPGEISRGRRVPIASSVCQIWSFSKEGQIPGYHFEKYSERLSAYIGPVSRNEACVRI
jgi:hypothetical protein